MGAASMAKFLGARQVEVPPGTVLRTVAEPLVGVGQVVLGLGVGGVRKDDMVEQLDREPQITGGNVVTGLGDGGGGAAHALDVPLAGLGGREFPQVSGIAVEPAQVVLVDGLDVVADRTVVAMGVPAVLQE